ncbi:MAG: DUF3137 domain-containing protein [Actinobacteria bacterium]|nr:DUF3137 domain-containing protein [Actinomycetota bacterium]
MSHGIGTWVLLAVGVAVVVGLVLWLRRRHYLNQVRALGWSHESNPTMADVADLQAPPFGLGLGRTVDELVAGTTPAGFGFRVFEYTYRDAGPSYSERVACLQLPFALPDAFLSGTGQPRVGIGMAGRTLVQGEEGGVRVITGDAGLVRDLLGGVEASVAAFGQRVGGIDLGVDGSRLVASGAPKDPDDLSGFLAALDPVAQAIAAAPALVARQVPPSAPNWYYGHPEWEFVGSDDTVLDTYPVTSDGYGHRTEDLVRGVRDGIRVEAFVHHWKTDRIETTTDSEGHTHTRTVTDDHSEPVCGFVLPFFFPALSVNGGRVGEKVRFESTDFNKAFTVRTADPKFASDVIHPRTMEWLLARRPRGWTVSGPVVAFEVEDHDLLIVDDCGEVLRGWLGRIPRFVWQDRSVPVPPYLVE